MTKPISETMFNRLRESSLESYILKIYEEVRKYGQKSQIPLAPVAIKDNVCYAFNEAGDPFELGFLQENLDIKILHHKPLVKESYINKVLNGDLSLNDLNLLREDLESNKHTTNLEQYLDFLDTGLVHKIVEENKKKITESFIKAVSRLSKPYYLSGYTDCLTEDSIATYELVVKDRLGQALESLEGLYSNSVSIRKKLRESVEKLNKITSENIRNNLAIFSEMIVEDLGDLVINLKNEDLSKIKLTQLSKIHDRIVSTKYNYEIGLCLVSETLVSIK